MVGSTTRSKPVFVLVHGAWHGGWCWRRVSERLTGAGYRVFAPTLTGLGDRAHLLSPAIGLETFVADLAAVLEAEELEDVVLVGHSFAGAVISGVADRMADRIRHLVYLDALLVGGGESPFDQVAPEVATARREAAFRSSGGLSLPAPAPESFGVTDPADIAWLSRRLTPHPLKSYEDRLMLRGALGAGLPATYVACADPPFATLSRSLARARAMPGWRVRELATGHDAMVTAPAETAALLREIAEWPAELLGAAG